MLKLKAYKRCSTGDLLFSIQILMDGLVDLISRSALAHGSDLETRHKTGGLTSDV
ncbi:MAG: hypothetical protein ABGX16_00215 [Pirellulales bacterium]